MRSQNMTNKEINELYNKYKIKSTRHTDEGNCVVVIASCLFLLVFIAIIEAVVATGILIVWNNLLVNLFSLHPIDFWGAVGILFLINLVGGAVGGYKNNIKN